MEIINKSKISNEQLEKLLKKQLFTHYQHFAFCDPWYKIQPLHCFATDKVIVVIMQEHIGFNVGDSGGIEGKSSIRIFNENLEKIGEVELKKYKHRSDERYDNYSLRLDEILSVEVKEDSVIVRCKTGNGVEREVFVKVKTQTKLSE